MDKIQPAGQKAGAARFEADVLWNFGTTAQVFPGIPHLLYRLLGHVMPMSSLGYAADIEEKHASSSKQEMSVHY